MKEQFMKRVARHTRGMNQKTKNTYNNVGSKLLAVLNRYTNITDMADFKPPKGLDEDELFDWEEDMLNQLEKALKLSLEAKPSTWGGVHSTITHNLGVARKILSQVGIPSGIIQTMKASQEQHLIRLGILGGQSVQDTTWSPSMIADVIEEMDRVLKGGDIDFKNGVTESKRIQACLYILISFTTAGRASSIKAVDWANISRDTISILITKHKGSRPILQPFAMNEQLWEMLQTWKNHQDSPKSGNIFTNKHDASKWASSVLRSAGVPEKNGRVGTHEMRKAFASWAFKNGIRVEEVAATLSHSDSATTERNYISNYSKHQVGMEKAQQFSEEFIGLARKMTEVEPIMTTFVEDAKLIKEADWGIGSDEYYMRNTKERDFLIESGVNPFTDAVYRYVPSDKMVVPPGFEPESGRSMLAHLKTALPHIDTALTEIKNGSSKTAEIILQALKEVLQ
jgi:hypothetical protein